MQHRRAVQPTTILSFRYRDDRCTIVPGSARVSRAGFRVSRKQSFSVVETVTKSSRTRDGFARHARRVRYPELDREGLGLARTRRFILVIVL